MKWVKGDKSCRIMECVQIKGNIGTKWVKELSPYLTSNINSFMTEVPII